MEIIHFEKSNLDESSASFKTNILLNQNRIDYLKELASKNKLYLKKELRPLAWKIYLETLTSDNQDSLKVWIDTIFNQRKQYKKKLEKYCSLKKLGLNDPLINDENNEKNNLLYNEEEQSTLNLINLDLMRTHQSLDIFQENKTKNILSNVLFIYAKEHGGDILYGQGMNELVAMIYICLYPYYFSVKNNNSNEKITNEMMYEYIKDVNKYYKKIYLYFHDEDEIQSDLYYLFEALETKGMNDLYERIDIKKSDPKYNLYELFPDIIKDQFDEDRSNHLNLRAYMIYKEKLKLIDKKLYHHLKRINVKCNYFMHRWLKCIFTREFELDEVLSLWDKIFFYELNSGKKYKYSFVYIDFICIAMLVNIRYILLKKDDDADCYTIIFHYPKEGNISNIMEISEKIAEIIEKKLERERYDINEVLNLIKRDENYNENEEDNNSDTNDELIIKPHMYNQRNKSKIISCDQYNEKIFFCGKYYIKTKILLIILLFLIIFILLIWAYNKFNLHSQK